MPGPASEGRLGDGAPAPEEDDDHLDASFTNGDREVAVDLGRVGGVPTLAGS